MNGMSSSLMRRSSARFSSVSAADSTIHHLPRIFTKLRPISRAARGEGWGEGARMYEKKLSIRTPSPSLPPIKSGVARPLPSGER